MKKILALLLALTMVFTLAACGGKIDPAPSGGGTAAPGTSQQTDPEPSQPEPSGGEDEGDNSLLLDNTYTDAQLSYMEALGKTAQGEKLVCYNEDYYGLTVYVVEWNKTENKTDSIIKYGFHTKEDMYKTDRDMTKDMAHYVEHSDDMMMICTDLSDTLADKADECSSFEQIAEDVLGDATILK